MTDSTAIAPAAAEAEEEAKPAKVDVPFLDVEPENDKPRHFVAGNTFISQTTDQGEIRVRLQFKTKLIRAIRNAGDQLDQFIALLDGIGDQKSIEQLDELDIFETSQIVEAFFTAYEKRQKATVGEIFALLDLIEEHRSALRFDFRHLLRLDLDAIGDKVTYGAAWDYVTELRMDITTHLYAAEQGFNHVATGGMPGLATILHAIAQINAVLPPGSETVRLPMPWDEPPPAPEPVPADEVERLRAELDKRSVLRGR